MTHEEAKNAILEREAGKVDIRQQLADVSHERDGFRVQVEEAERFVEYLINNCVGQVVSEGKIKYWMACSIERHAKEKSTEQRAQS